MIGASEERVTARILKEFLTDEEGSMSITIRNRPASQELVDYLNRIFRFRTFRNDEEDVRDSSRLAVYQIEKFQSNYIYFRIEILALLFQLNFGIIVDESQDFKIIDVVELEWFEEVDLESYAPPGEQVAAGNVH